MTDIWESIPKEIAQSKKKKYVFGTTQSSFAVFLMSLNDNVYIEAFIFDNDNSLDSAFNKKIVQMEDVPEDSIVLVPDDLISSLKGVNKKYVEIQKIYIHRLAEPIRNEEVYIWGTGNNGSKTFNLLTENSVKVKGFIESDPQQGKIVSGLPVFPPECIDPNEIIVISSIYYKEILDSPGNQKFKNIFIDYGTMYGSEYPHIILENQKEADVVWNLPLHFLTLMRDIINKDIIIYGYNKLGSELKRIFQLMDKQVKYFIEDEAVENADDIVKNKFDVLYENASDKIILVCKLRENAKKELVCDALSQLENMGLKYGFDFREIQSISGEAIRDARIGSYGCKLDPMLGHTLTYPETSKTYNQYVVLGNENKNDLKIMILGGSTSDIGLYQPEKSWPEFLWERLNKRAVIFGGGIAAYTSVQECLKLLRDIGSIKPDIVISYSGVNDIRPMRVEGHPFIHNFQLTAMRNVDSSYSIDEGIVSNEDIGSLWLRMEESMCGIAQACGCRFYGILQPAIFNKQFLVKREKLINTYGGNTFTKNCSYEIVKRRYEELINAFEKYAGKNKSLYNLSGLFQESREEIFKDQVHVYEKGNDLVAEKILEIIQRA